MKKLISLVVTFVIMVCALSFNTVLADGENLVFELDLSEATDTNIVAKNAVAESNSQVSVLGSPALGQINGKNYINFRDEYALEAQGEGSAIKIIESSFINQNEMSFEVWVKSDDFDYNYGTGEGQDNNAHQQRLMTFANSDTTDDTTVDVMMYGQEMYYRPGGVLSKNTASKDIQWVYSEPVRACDNQWTHLVFTRKVADVSTYKQWLGELYINGARAGASSYTTNSLTSSRVAENENAYFMLGNRSSLNNTFVGSIAAFKVYNSVLSAEAISEKYAASKERYAELPQSMTVVSTSVANGAQIDTAPGKISVTFDNYIDEATLKNVKFTKEDGTSFGATLAEAESDFSKTAVIRYGRLEEKEKYKLIIPNSVKSKNGVSAEPAEYTYTAKKTYVVNEDFQNYAEGAQAPSLTGISYVSAGAANDSSAMSIKDINGDKYLAITPTATDTNYRVTYTPSNVWADNDASKLRMADNDVSVIDLKIKSVSTPKTAGEESEVSVARNLLTLNGHTPVGVMNDDVPRIYRRASAYVATPAHRNAVTEKDENGFYNIRFAIKARTDNGQRLYGYEVVDLISGSTIYNFEPDITFYNNYNSAGKADILRYLMNIELAHIYPQATDKYNVESGFSEIKIYDDRLMEVLDTGKYSHITKSFTFALSDDINIDTLDNITVSKDGQAVTANPSYNAANRTITLAFDEELVGEYAVSLEYLSSENKLLCADKTITFTAEKGTYLSSISFTDANGTVLNTLEGATTVKAEAILCNWGGEEPVAFVAIYDANELVKVKKATISENADGLLVSAQLDGFSLTKDGDAKILVWDSFQTIMPITAVASFGGDGL